MVGFQRCEYGFDGPKIVPSSHGACIPVPRDEVLLRQKREVDVMELDSSVPFVSVTRERLDMLLVVECD